MENFEVKGHQVKLAFLYNNPIKTIFKEFFIIILNNDLYGIVL